MERVEEQSNFSGALARARKESAEYEYNDMNGSLHSSRRTCVNRLPRRAVPGWGVAVGMGRGG